MRKIVDDHTVEVIVDIATQSEKPDYPDVGDRIELVRGQTLEPYAPNEIAGVEVCPDGGLRLQLRQPIPEGLAETDLIANLTRAASLTIRNCSVRNNRARAFLVQTRDVEIENCTFDHCTGTAIHLNCSIYWYESLSVNRVSVRNNRFVECGFGAGTIGGAEAMVVSVESPGAVVGVHRDIRFTGNVIHGRNGMALRIESAQGVRVEGNEFISSSPIALIDDSREVVFRNNRFDVVQAQFVIGKGCCEKSIELRDEACEIKQMR
ncbi:right-handed parallel beta-helix repeat-containing protein [Cohnella herbarum]|uniref:Right-handed parallel beta-helix repeat-containing protein n=1 Tax=Cohnella herbarum TaxID=2728023 RepID=A0A7Z2VQ71_9BACL|nr:right-handed parallel beta-helix repeat-containing protein [Cohnella herbarum]QJD87107.1 right-handed parallel beta-helix repeat-containing protein [Cohnella herbarum]